MAPRTRTILMSGYASARDYQRAIECGAVRVVSKPFTSSELLQAIRQAVECETGFRGSIHGLSLVDLLQMFHYARRSLAIVVDGLAPGQVFLEDGHVIHAAYRELHGEPALQAILAMPAGSLRTMVLPHSTPRTITRDFQTLLLDSLRTVDEGAHPASEWEPDELDASMPGAPLPHLQRLIEALRQLDGYSAAMMVDGESGLVVGGDHRVSNLALQTAATGYSELYRIERDLVDSLCVGDEIEDVVITLSSQYHVLHAVAGRPSLLLCVVLDRNSTSLGLARYAIKASDRFVRGASSMATLIDLLAAVDDRPASESGAFVVDGDGDGEVLGSVFVEISQVCWAAATGRGARLRDLLRQHAERPLDDSELDDVFARCRDEHRALASVLVERELVSDHGLRAALKQHTVESLIAQCDGADRAVTWVPHRQRGYRARFTFPPIELLAAAGAELYPTEAGRRRSRARRRATRRADRGSFAIGDSDEPVAVRVAGRSVVAVRDLLELGDVGRRGARGVQRVLTGRHGARGRRRHRLGCAGLALGAPAGPRRGDRRPRGAAGGHLRARAARPSHGPVVSAPRAAARFRTHASPIDRLNPNRRLHMANCKRDPTQAHGDRRLHRLLHRRQQQRHDARRRRRRARSTSRSPPPATPRSCAPSARR